MAWFEESAVKDHMYRIRACRSYQADWVMPTNTRGGLEYEIPKLKALDFFPI